MCIRDRFKSATNEGEFDRARFYRSQGIDFSVNADSIKTSAGKHAVSYTHLDVYKRQVYTHMRFGWQIGLAYGSEIVLALINLLVFIYGCKHRLSFRQNMHQKRRKAQFKAQFSEPRPGSGIRCV